MAVRAIYTVPVSLLCSGMCSNHKRLWEEERRSGGGARGGESDEVREGWGEKKKSPRAPRAVVDQ
jgi:hypothetical protein